MSVSEKKRKWLEFVAAFSALGDETLGMTPAAASLLALSVAEYMRDPNKGYPLDAGAPIYAAASEFGGPMIRVPDEYPPGFWSIDRDYVRAQVTAAAQAYILSHIEVFALLSGL